MLTTLCNMKALYSLCLIQSFAVEKLTPAVDTDRDGDLDMLDISKFDDNTQEAIRRVLWEANMSTLESWKRFAMQDLIENGFVVERTDTISGANSSQSELADEIANNQTRRITRDPWTRQDIASESSEVSSEFTRTLRRGLSGPDVTTLQQALSDKWFNPNGIDGVFGPWTERALIAYQKQVLGQRGDGVMDFNGATMRSLTQDVNLEEWSSNDSNTQRRITQNPWSTWVFR